MPRTVALVQVPWTGFRPFASGIAGALAWTDGRMQVYVRNGMDVNLWGPQRVAHELQHVLDGEAFGTAADAGHHPWWHFCIRAGHPLRLFWRHTDISRGEAATLTDRGHLDLR